MSRGRHQQLGFLRRRPHARRGIGILSLVLAVLTVGLAVGINPASAQYATGGSGLYKGTIDWFEWGSAGQSIPAGGTTRTNTRTIAGQTLATTCTISNIQGDQGGLQTYRPGTWVGDALDNLYNVGGANTSNQLVNGLANSVYGDTVGFHFACSATLDGVPIPLQGLVMGDAEASNTWVNDPAANEYIQATPDQAGTVWRVIDRYGDCATSADATLTGNTLRLAPDGLECVGIDGTPGPMAVAFMDGATSASVELKGGGHTAIALGVVLQTDFGDAPASYGAAGSIIDPGWQGGTVPAGTTNVSSTSFTLGTPKAPSLMLGSSIDSEAAPPVLERRERR